MSVKVTACNCDHKFQDETYGKKNRVHNSCGKTTESFKCTVCGNEKKNKTSK